MRVLGIDHVVLWVSDVEASVQWYQALLGVEVDRLAEWRRGDAPFPSVRINATTVIDLFAAREGDGPPPGGTDHVALLVEHVDLDELAARPDLDVVGPPMVLWGAQGHGRGVYVRDPDGNRIELRVYD